MMSEENYKPEVRGGFRIAEMTKRYWGLQLKTLTVIDGICRNHGIKWFADFGTLLGAVRHQGFIPWDDDIDICMLRDDYERLISVAPEELPPSYSILDVGVNPDYHDQIGRIVNNHRIQFDTAYLADNCGCPYTAGVDIFIMDGLYENDDAEEDRRSRAMALRKVLSQITTDEIDSKENRMLLHRIEAEYGVRFKPDKDSVIHSMALLIREIYKECPVSEASRVAYMNAWTSWKGHSHDKKCFDEMTYLPYEDSSVAVPILYDDVLKEEFGDYMKIVRGYGADHPYPVYIVQQKIMLDYLAEHPNDALRNYILSTADKHTEDFGRCVEILDMCDQVMNAIRGGVSADVTSCISLLDGIGTLMDTLSGLLLNDYSSKARVQSEIIGIKDLIGQITTDSTNGSDGGAFDFDSYIQTLIDSLNRIRAGINELYNGQDPIDCVD
ncbi:MAG: LicD family protein [Lachnospiraceae bacterium]|nr:LicD family protein [Lachnospiraceae bacterium]